MGYIAVFIAGIVVEFYYHDKIDTYVTKAVELVKALYAKFKG